MFFTQSGFSPSVITTSGNATIDATDGSESSFSTILTASSPFASGCAFDHAVAFGELVGVGRRHQHLRQQRIRIQSDLRRHLVELLITERLGVLRLRHSTT